MGWSDKVLTSPESQETGSSPKQAYEFVKDLV